MGQQDCNPVSPQLNPHLTPVLAVVHFGVVCQEAEQCLLQWCWSHFCCGLSLSQGHPQVHVSDQTFNVWCRTGSYVLIGTHVLYQILVVHKDLVQEVCVKVGFGLVSGPTPT